MNPGLNTRMTVEQAAIHILKQFRYNKGQARCECSKRASFSVAPEVKVFYAAVRAAIKEIDG